MQNYNPLQWPPDRNLAQLHYQCSKPGIDDPQGKRCPCCNRLEKLGDLRWGGRSILKDFITYGGGVPGYFLLVLYFIVILSVLFVIKGVYQIYLLQKVCPTLEGTQNQCTSAFVIFKFCAAQILYKQLIVLNEETDAIVLEALQMATYIILVAATVAIRPFLHWINKDHNIDQKLFSRFALLIKSVPLYYQIEDIKQQIKVIAPEAQIVQIFYVHKTCQLQKVFRSLCEDYFKILNSEQIQRQKQLQQKQKVQFQQLKIKYLKDYNQFQMLGQRLNSNSKKMIIVFQNVASKQKVHDALRVGEIKKFAHYLSKNIGCNNEAISYYTERIAQPQQIHWKYIGQSSTKKLKVRLQTTVIGVGFMIIAFGIFYFPMIKIDQQKQKAPGLGTGLGLIISILIIILATVYRIILLRLMPTRRPSSKLAESYFIVLTTIIFHFFFYLFSPAAFYEFADKIPKNSKLKQLFMAILGFVLMSVAVAAIDVRYRLFKGRRQKLLSGAAAASAGMCQGKLHQQVNPPSFPIQFKLMMVFNIWSFNSFYIFELPYLILFFLLVLVIVYWIDKHNLYNHYKMQHYLSLDLEIKVQKTFIIVFLISVSIGFFLAAQFAWERYTVIVVAILGLAANFFLHYTAKVNKNNILRHDTDLKAALDQCRNDPKASMHLNMLQNQMKRSFLIKDNTNIPFFSQTSLASQIVMYGYSQTYNFYLSQFKNKQMNSKLQQKYHLLQKRHPRKASESQMARIFDSPNQPLLDKIGEVKQESIQQIQILQQNKYVSPEIINKQKQDIQNNQKNNKEN